MNYAEICIIKRDGKREDFSISKIKNAISKAFSATGITGNYLCAEYQHHEIPLSVLLQRGSDEGEKQRDIYRQQRRYHQYGIYAL